jgi:hypothetical protein
MRALCLFALLVLLSTSASASVFLNGVNIDGVTNQTFENCTVVVDDKGNILITAKGYEVHQPAPTTAPPTPPKPPPVTKSYFLIAETALGDSQYDVDIFINSVFVKRVLSTDAQLTLDVSKFLNTGKNTVHFTAVKNLKEGRKSLSAEHALRIHVGEGTQTPETIVLDQVLIEYARTAAEMGNFDNDVVVTGR